MLNYPNIDPIALRLGPIELRWYGLMYLIGFLSAWGLANYRIRHYKSPITTSEVSDLIFYLAVGTIVGGRLGYALFYDPAYFLENPLNLLKLWTGGMSFHGGLLGVLCALFLFSLKLHKPFFEITDFVAPLVPIGLAFGRLGNFINGELYGRAADVPWAMIFPNGGNVLRHPSQLYEFALEGVLLFLLVWMYAKKPRPEMAVSGVFLIGYGSFRIIAEFFRAPDMGFIAFNWLTMGQLLSIPMVIFGIFLLFCAYQKVNDKFNGPLA